MDQFVHPELQKGEVFLTNSDAKGFAQTDWKSKRRGFKAYDGEGNLLSSKDWFPIFVKSEDLEKVNLDLRTARRKWKEIYEALQIT